MNKINEETYYGILPLKTSERIYSFKDTFLVTAGYGIATWCFVQGAWISSTLPLYLALLITFASMLLFTIPTLLVTIVPSRYGCDIWIYQRAVYGYRLNLIFLLIALTFSSGWDAVNARIFADSIILLADHMGIYIPSSYTPWLGLICVMLGFFIAVCGPIAIKKTTTIIVPVLLLIGVFMIITIFIKSSPAKLNQVIPLSVSEYTSTGNALSYVLESNFAYAFAWFACIGVLPRLTKSERGSLWGHILGLGIAMIIFVCVGIIGGTYMSSLGIYSENPIEALMHISGSFFGSIGLIAITFANISTQALDLYCYTLATKILKPEWSYRKVMTGWLIIILVFTFSEKIWDYYSSFVTIGGCIYAPAIAIFLVDFFLVRKQRFSLYSAYIRGESAYQYTGGFNLVTVIAFSAGVVSYFLLFDPISYTARSPLFFYFTATGTSFIVAGLAYWLMSRVSLCRKYLLQDR